MFSDHEILQHPRKDQEKELLQSAWRVTQGYSGTDKKRVLQAVHYAPSGQAQGERRVARKISTDQRGLQRAKQ